MLLCEQVSALPRIVIAPFSVKRVLHPVLTLSEICLRFFAMYYQTRPGVQQCQAQGLVFCPWIGSSLGQKWDM